MALAPSQSLLSNSLLFRPTTRHIFEHQSYISASVLNGHSVSLCTLFLHSACHIQGYTYHKVTSQQVLSLRLLHSKGEQRHLQQHREQPREAHRIIELRRNRWPATSSSAHVRTSTEFDGLFNGLTWNVRFTSSPTRSASSTRSSRYPPCLLYTSPSPRDKRQSRMPSSA